MSHIEQTIKLCKIAVIKMASHFISNPRSHAVSTKRTILSPFTKEYRVHAANSGIRLFLEELFLWKAPKNASLTFSNSVILTYWLWMSTLEVEPKENKKKALRSEEIRGLKALCKRNEFLSKKRQDRWGVHTTFKRVLYLIGDLYKYIVSRIISWIKKRTIEYFLHCLSQKY